MAEIREYVEVQFRERVSEPVGNGMARHIKILGDVRRKFYRDMADPNTLVCLDLESKRITEYPWGIVCFAKLAPPPKLAEPKPPEPKPTPEGKATARIGDARL
jgi:hypothetical protein